jgi:soluble lytic murein transglycosylase-like protein
MRGIDLTFSRLPVARAFIAGAAILAGASASKAVAQPQGNGDEIAFAVPRIAPRGGGPVALPQPLPPSEAVRIRRIFMLQQAGNVATAAREAELLDTALTVRGQALGHAMLGHILADRYLGRFSKPGPDLLQYWLAGFADLPDAPAIHALLASRMPHGTKLPAPPSIVGLASEQAPTSGPVPVPEETEPALRALARNPGLDRSVWEAARSGRYDAVPRLLARTKGLSPSYASQLRGEAGQILFTLNRDQEAYDVASEGARLCGRRADCQDAALAGYAAGLAAWRMSRGDLARPMFEAAWRAEGTTSALKAAAAFWAARAHLRVGDPAGYVPWMNRAAEERRTFYGLLARRTLGLGIGFAPSGREERETLAEADIEAVAATPEGLRAFALLQVGQDTRAESELRRLWPAAQNRPALGRSIMLVAKAAGLVDLAAQLADLVAAADGRPRETTRFPIPHLRPDGGFTVDPALIYAVARTESNFDATMTSSAGARGLMQIMPETARFVMGAARPAALLDDPEYNLFLGQRYVAYLAKHDAVNGNLLRLLASYNSGPNGFAKWNGNLRHNGDPLLFIEAIPVDETRAYVPRVLTYTWIYAARMHLPAPSLDELAAGAWPVYHPLSPRQEPPPRVH